MKARESFAIVLREIRLEKQLSQEKLAAIADISMRTVSLLECNKQQPTITTLESLAASLGITMTEFISRVESNTAKQFRR